MTPSRNLYALLISGLIGANILVFMFSGYWLYQSRQHYEQRAQTMTQDIANAVDQNVSSSIEKIDLVLRTLVDELEHQLAAKGIDEQAMQAFLATHEKRLPEVESFRVANADGLVILGKGLNKKDHVSWADRDYFIHHRDHNDGTLQISEPRVGRITRQYIVGFARRYNYPDGRFAGVVSAAITLDHFTQLLSQFNPGPHGTLILRDAGLGLITRFPPIPDQAAGTVGHRGVSEEFRQQVDSGVSSATYHIPLTPDGVERTATFRRLKEAPMIAIVGAASEDYLQDWYTEAYRTAGLSFGFLLLSLLSARFVLYFLRLTLRESTRNQRYLQRASDGIHILDRHGDLVEANDRFCTMLGYRRDELLGANVAMWDAQWSSDTLQHEILSQVFSLNDAATIETRHRTKGGEVIDVEVNLSTFEVDGASYLYASSRNITERKQAEAEILALNQCLEDRVQERTQELHLKEEQLREALVLNENILMTSAVGISAYRQDGQCVMANPALAELLGGTVAQLLTQNFHQLASWRMSGLLDTARRVLASGTHEEFETRLTSSFGRDIWVHAQLSRLATHDEPHLLLMLHDITAQRQAVDALAEREREFHSLADNVPDNVIRYDLEGRALYLNKTLEATLGCPAAELLGKTAREAAPDGRYDALNEVVRQVAESGASVEFEQIVPGPDGQPRYHSIRIVAEMGLDGRPTSVLAVGRDLTAQKITEEELRLAASVFHNSAEGVMVTDAAGSIVSVNPAFSEITGYTEAEALGQNPRLLRSDRQEPAFYRAMWEDLTGNGHWQGEIWNRKKCGEAYLEWLTINRIDDRAGTPVRYVSVFHDITEMRRKDEHIHHLAFHDALTGLPNRTLMHDRLQNALARAQRENRRLSVTFIDLDRFKSVNDGFGHDIGDLLLQEVAQRLKNRLRAADTVARLGGDEFVVLMEDIKEAGDCACLAQDLIAEIARPMQLRGHTVEIGASMGMAFFPEDGSEPLELMKCADMAMYAAKAAGRNTYRFFRQDMMARTSQRLTLEMDLRRAIANRDLELHYQPKVAMTTGRPVGVEALVRWRHPVRGLLPPGEFIPLAEESGLIVELGAWVLNEACRQAAEWRAAGHAIKIAVNVSAWELEAGDLVEHIAKLTVQHGIAPADLEIELTESTVMANPESVAGVFARLRQLGSTVAVDDFGTGYSSLAYLRRLPIDVLKIDRSFVMDADRNDEDAQIVRTILALGQALKLTVVAEGIETRGQAELLKSLGCDIAQGYYFSRPLPAREAGDWLDTASAVCVEGDG